MKKIYLLILLLPSILCFSQTPDVNEIRTKMQAYYAGHSPDLVAVQISTKSSLGFDTSIYMNAFVPSLVNNKNAFAAAYIKPDTTVGFILLYDGDYYIVSPGKPEKVKIKNNNLPGAGCYPFSKTIIESDPGNIEKVLGKFTSAKLIGEEYWVGTSKNLLIVDTANYRIKKQTRYDVYNDKIGFTEYEYISFPISKKEKLLKAVNELASNAQTIQPTTFKEMNKLKPTTQRFENTKFQFTDQPSFNKGILDSARIAGKYVIYDFFYRACLPCHKMTGYILDWMPSVDTSKIMLVGINPVDSEEAMKEFAKERNITYPVIIGEEAKAIAKYYVSGGYPTLLLVSPEGIIMDINEGMSKAFLTKAEKIMEKANKTLQ